MYTENYDHMHSVQQGLIPLLVILPIYKISNWQLILLHKGKIS